MTKMLLKISVKYGAVAGVLAFVMLIVMFYMGPHPLLTSPFLDFRIILFGIFTFFTLKEFRGYHGSGILYFWQAMLGGLIVVLISTTITSCLLWLFGRWEKDFVVSYVTQFTAYLQSFPQEDIDRIGKETYERNLTRLPATNVLDLVETYFVQGTIIGLFVTIIISAILRRQPKP